EAQAVTGDQRRLRAGDTHARAEPAVELDDGDLPKRRGPLLVVGLDRGELRHLDQRVDLGLGHLATGAVGQLLPVVLENRDRARVHPALAHPCRRLVPRIGFHAGHPTMSPWRRRGMSVAGCGRPAAGSSPCATSTPTRPTSRGGWPPSSPGCPPAQRCSPTNHCPTSPRQGTSTRCCWRPVTGCSYRSRCRTGAWS